MFTQTTPSASPAGTDDRRPLLAELIDTSASHDTHKADVVTPAQGVRWDEQALLIAQHNGGAMAPASMRRDAFSDVCKKLAHAVFGQGTSRTLPADYLLACPPDVRAFALNSHAANARLGAKWMVRYYADTVRAVMDGNYPGGAVEGGDFENTTYLKIVSEFVEASRAKLPDLRLIKGSHVSEDDLNLKLVWKDVQRGQSKGGYGIGVYIGNGETGGRSLKVLPLIQRTACTNSLMTDEGEDSLVMVHRGSFAGMRAAFKEAIGRALSAAGELLEKMLAAELEQIPDFDDVLAGLALKHGWDDDTRQAVAAGTERESTRAAIVNGMTWAAHMTNRDPNAQADMEIAAGRILAAPESLFAEAARMAKQERAGLLR